MKNHNNILITGTAGFIGFHVCMKLLEEDINLIGFDNINNYYETDIKNDRLIKIEKKGNKNNNWKFIKGDLENINFLLEIFKNYKPDAVIHLAAQAGVRYSIINPKAYINSNLIGFSNILECCRINNIKNFIYASSSSVYGGNTKMPFSENDQVNHPVSLYAATKRSNEIMAHSYSHLYGIPSTGLRFFTVYGPWGRPDMAPMLFTKAILENEPIKVFNHGNMFRDFTYVDDVVEIISRLLQKPAIPNANFNKEEPEPATSWAPHMIFNVGNNKPITLKKFIQAIEKELNKEAKKEFLDIQKGDVVGTYCNNKLISNWIGYRPKTLLDNGIKEFIIWYKSYYHHE